MTSYISDDTLFISDFDESIDELMIDFINLVKRKILLAASKPEHVASIEVWVNSMGGDSHRAFALVELMEWAKWGGVYVNTVVLSEAASSGSIVAAAGSKGHRRTTKNAFYMMHYGDIDMQATSPLDLQRQTDAYHTHFNHIAQHYADNSNKPLAWWNESLKTDNLYLTGEEAVEHGLADGFLGG